MTPYLKQSNYHSMNNLSLVVFIFRKPVSRIQPEKSNGTIDHYHRTIELK